MSWTALASAPKSAPSSGNPGRYRSVATGASAASDASTSSNGHRIAEIRAGAPAPALVSVTAPVHQRCGTRGTRHRAHGSDRPW